MWWAILSLSQDNVATSTSGPPPNLHPIFFSYVVKPLFCQEGSDHLSALVVIKDSGEPGADQDGYGLVQADVESLRYFIYKSQE
jgi:hypothetical protein